MLDRGWADVTERLGLPASMSAHYGPVKLPLISPILARLGLSGVYSPYTAEPNVVRRMPAMRLPAAMAHEQAHQRGIAIEAEASFLGILVGARSADPLARYSAVSFAQAQLVGWLEGLFHGIQATLFAQQLAARQQLEQMRGQIGPGGGMPGRPMPEGMPDPRDGERPGTYL